MRFMVRMWLVSAGAGPLMESGTVWSSWFPFFANIDESVGIQFVWKGIEAFAGHIFSESHRSRIHLQFVY